MRTIFLMLALVASAPVFSQDDSSAFVGLRFGDTMKNRVPAAGAARIDTDNVLGGYIGFKIAPNWAIDASFTDLGKSTQDGIADGGFNLDGSLWTLGASYHRDFNSRFSGFVGAGFFKLNEDGSQNSIVGPRNFDNDQSGAYAELGVRLALAEQFGARFSYQHFAFDKSDGTPWLGLDFRF